MASTYSTNLAIELIGTGDQAGSWGNTTNTNLGTLIEQAISGYVTQAVSTGTDTTITIPNGATGVARNMYIELTGTGGTNTNLIVPANKKLYFIFNNSTGAVTVKVSGQTGVSVPNGKKMVLVSNGTDVVVAENYIADFGSNSATITNLTCTSLTLSNNPTFSGGTANGVLYLNGSKVATSGSGFTYDGTSALISGGNFRINRATNTSVLTLGGSPTDNWEGEIQFVTSNSAVNWRLASNRTTGGAFTITPSTAAGGSTFTTPAITVDNASNVGIGTASPASKLDTAGTIRATSQTVPSSGTGAELFYDATNAGLRGYNRTGSAYVNLALNDNVYIGGGSSGNVGIGTASPSTKLTVYDATTPQVTFNNGTSSFIVGNNSGGNNKILYGTGAYPMIFYTNATEAMQIDASQNLGLGVTPSAWQSASGASWDVIDIGGAGALAFSPAGSNDLTLAANAFYDNTDSRWEYKNTGDKAARYSVTSGGTHVWYITNSTGTANNPISFTDAMTLDASGNLLLGGTSTAQLDGAFGQLIGSSSKTTAAIALETQYGAYMMYTDGTDSLIFWDSGDNAERGRFTAGGYFKASNTGTYASSTGAYHEVRSNQDGNTFVVGNTSTSTNTDGTIFIQNARNTTNNTYYIIGAYNTAAAAFKFRVADSGDVTNTNGTYGTISDAKMKTDIVDAGSQWADLKAVRFRKFKMKDDPSGLMQLGVVAQELEQTSPGLVDEHADRDAEGNDLGTTTKSVKTSVLLMKAAVALQEAMARIEQLEADMAALKASA